jgi:hypothetical protein
VRLGLALTSWDVALLRDSRVDRGEFEPLADLRRNLKRQIDGFGFLDDKVVERWRDTPRWQYFSSCAYYEDRLPSNTPFYDAQRLNSPACAALSRSVRVDCRVWLFFL